MTEIKRIYKKNCICVVKIAKTPGQSLGFSFTAYYVSETYTDTLAKITATKLEQFEAAGLLEQALQLLPVELSEP